MTECCKNCVHSKELEYSGWNYCSCNKCEVEVRADERIKVLDEFVEYVNTMPTYEDTYGEIMPMPIEMMAEKFKEQKK